MGQGACEHNYTGQQPNKGTTSKQVGGAGTYDVAMGRTGTYACCDSVSDVEKGRRAQPSQYRVSPVRRGANEHGGWSTHNTGRKDASTATSKRRAVYSINTANKEPDDYESRQYSDTQRINVAT